MEQKQLEAIIEDLQDKVGKMYYALVGNEMAKDGGLIGRLERLETHGETQNKEVCTRLDKLEDNFKDLEVKTSKADFQRSIMWGIGGIALGLVLNYILPLFIHK